MTNKELQELLNTFPPDLQVVFEKNDSMKIVQTAEVRARKVYLKTFGYGPTESLKQ